MRASAPRENRGFWTQAPKAMTGAWGGPVLTVKGRTLGLPNHGRRARRVTA